MKKMFDPRDPKLEPHAHPELQPGEVFLTNTSKDDDFKPKGDPELDWPTELKTIRRGMVAYGRNNQVVPHCEPIFVQRSELEAAGIDADDPFGYRRSRVDFDRFIEKLKHEDPGWRECHGFISQVESYVIDGLPDVLAEHVESCPSCRVSIDLSGHTLEELRATWRAKEPERKAWAKFKQDLNTWYETWNGTIYLYFGGPYWSRRAKWLRHPRWEDYAPK